MRRLRIGFAAGLVTAVFIGCGPGKELPEELPRHKDKNTGTGTRPAEVGLKVPTVSDPEAREVVERAIRLCTQNDPTRLAKGKLSRSLSVGWMKLPLDGAKDLVSIPTERELLARWPDEVKVTYKHKEGLVGVNTVLLRSGLTGFFVNNEPRSNLNPRAMEEIIRTDALARHWLPLLFPLQDRDAVVFDLRKGIGTPPMDVVRFTMPERPVYQLSFDPTTGYLMGVEYHHREFETNFFKSWSFKNHSTFDGLILPTRMEYIQAPERSRTREIVEDWTISTWEFPSKLDDSMFDPPK
jgi:hypothetical protein